MLETPEIVETETQKAAVIHVTIPRDQIHEAMGVGYQELDSTLRAQGIEPAGPRFSHHFKMDPDTFDFEIGFPVTKAVSPTGRVRMGSLPAAKVIRTVYAGGYEGLGEAWGEFDEAVKSRGLETAPDLWEVYMVGPESGPDASKYRTELNRPLV